MRLLRKNRRTGFTLIEMVVVVGIIVILASVLFIAASQYLKQASTVKNKVSVNNSSFSSLNNDINSDFVSLGY